MTSKIRTLIVDDEPVARARVLSLLRDEADIEVVGECSNGHQAVSVIEATAPDLVFVHVQIPDMDGYDTMRAIRKFGKFRTLPVIALTAKAMKGDREKCIDAGASDYIAKPVDTTELLSMLRLWLYR